MASAELRIINRRIKSVKSTKKITRAMELIASSRIVKAQQRLTSSNNYTNLLAQIVEELTGSGEMPTSPAIEGTKKITLVVITSDRGLAGAYNTNILKLAEIDYFLTQKISWNQFNEFPFLKTSKLTKLFSKSRESSPFIISLKFLFFGFLMFLE